MEDVQQKKEETGNSPCVLVFISTHPCSKRSVMPTRSYCINREIAAIKVKIHNLSKVVAKLKFCSRLTTGDKKRMGLIPPWLRPNLIPLMHHSF